MSFLKIWENLWGFSLFCQDDFHGRLVVEFIEDHLSLAVLSFNAGHDSLRLSSLKGRDHPNDDTTAKHHLATTMTHSRQMTIIFLSLFFCFDLLFFYNLQSLGSIKSLENQLSWLLMRKLFNCNRRLSIFLYNMLLSLILWGLFSEVIGRHQSAMMKRGNQQWCSSHGIKLLTSQAQKFSRSTTTRISSAALLSECSVCNFPRF